MTQLVFIESNRVVTDSLTIAESFGKSHDKVMRDIRNLECSPGFSLANFGESTYENERGRTYKRYLITQDGFSFLVFGYTGSAAAAFKERYIAEFNRMRGQLQQANVGSYMIEDPIERAKRWIQEQEEKREIEQRAALYEEKANYVDDILKSKATVTTTQIAKDYGMSAMQLNRILKEERIQFKQKGQWLLYAKYHNKGYTKSRTVDIQRSDGRDEVVMNTQWTQSGRLFIHRILERRGKIALIEQELQYG
ncbi:phage regulatory protein/antirepressor Ant [Alkalihalobacillus sp. FSL W8-0930]